MLPVLSSAAMPGCILILGFRYYQEQFSKALTEKYSNLSVDFDKLINDANVEVSALQSKLARKST